MSNTKVHTADDVLSELLAQFGQPEPGDWRNSYTPERAVEFAAELADLEDQLDLGWPAWRERKPFGDQPIEKIGWIKPRLLRRQLILTGRGDYGVALVHRPSDGRPMCVPVRPVRRGEMTAAFRALTTSPLLAARLGMPVAQVDEMLARMPLKVRDVRSWLVGERGKATSGPLRVAPPLSDLPKVTP